MNRSELAGMIDHSVLSPAAGAKELAAACALGRRWKLATVCVKPCHVHAAAGLLAGSGVGVSAVVSFPHGADIPAIKAEQARAAVRAGAAELDMVLNIAALLDGDLGAVRQDIASVVDAAGGRTVKVILECGLLTDDQKRQACQAALAAGAAFVKTSTGFGPSGAVVADVRLLRSAVGARAGVKAAGGIRRLADALNMIAAGANRLGTSATAGILAELND